MPRLGTGEDFVSVTSFDPFFVMPLFRTYRLVFCIAMISASAFGSNWDPVDQSEFSRSRSVVDEGEGAEFVFRTIDINQFLVGWRLETESRHHLLARIFNEDGVNKLKVFKHPIQHGMRIVKLEARTIKPDGNYIELDPDNVYETELVRSSRGKVKAMAFPVPALEVGDLVEVKFLIKGMRANFSYSLNQSIPSRSTTIDVRPLDSFTVPSNPPVSYASRVVGLNFGDGEAKQQKDGSVLFELINSKAMPDEDFRVPDIHSRPSVIVDYISSKTPNLTRYWKETGAGLYRESKRRSKGSRKLESKVKELLSGVKEERARLRLIYDFCVSDIRNTYSDFGYYTDTEKEKLRRNDNPSETLERGYGNPSDVSYLFIAMANAAGFEARLASVSDRRDLLFTRQFKYPFALKDEIVAVSLGGDWRFFDPSSPILPFGELNWWNADSSILLSDPKEEIFLRTSGLPAKESSTQRSGELSIDSSGKLRGRVVESSAGCEAQEFRNEFADLPEEEAKERIRSRTAAAISRAVVSNISIENLKTIEEPVVVSYDLEVPDFATVVGDRIIFQPVVFQKEREAIFQGEEERVADILFPYPRMKRDQFSFILPDGYELEELQRPESFSIDGVVDFSCELHGVEGAARLEFDRSYSLHRNLFKAKANTIFSMLFSKLNVEDRYAVTFRRSASAQHPRIGYRSSISPTKDLETASKKTPPLAS
ncbi:hypothetical protein VDG1235_1311 [Verrucomicrobiia bacterium DG1235]|nr:hypothetical protein VDG1235_1311 [Verrucomicrobiae bacterium DG1235]